MTHSTRKPAAGEPMTTALFFAETRNRAEIDEVAHLAVDLSQHGEIRRISEGIITSYAVRLPASGTPLLSGLETTLKRDFVFGHVEIPFQDTIYRVVEDLAMDTGSRLTPVEFCEICQTPEPFPADVQVRGEDGRMRRSASVYCAACAANMAAGRIQEAPETTGADMADAETPARARA